MIVMSISGSYRVFLLVSLRIEKTRIWLMNVGVEKCQQLVLMSESLRDLGVAIWRLTFYVLVPNVNPRFVSKPRICARISPHARYGVKREFGTQEAQSRASEFQEWLSSMQGA